MRRIGLFSGIVAGGLVLASPALAGWGEDWGTMVWGAAPVGVPTLGLLGLGLLSLALAAGAVFSLRRRAWTMSVLLVALAIPLAAVASPITGLNTFSNGTTADANEVNANFDAVETAVNDNDSRITAVESETATAQSTADTAVTDAAAAQSTADAAVTDAAAAQSTADTAATAVAAEATARAAADTSLQTAIDSETVSWSTGDAVLQAAVDSEAESRASADTTLQASIDAEGVARSFGDSVFDTRVMQLESGVLWKDGDVPATGETSSASVNAEPVYTVTNTSSYIVSTAWPAPVKDIVPSSEGLRAEVSPSSTVGEGTRAGIHGIASVADDGSAPGVPVINIGVRGTASGDAGDANSLVYNVGLFGEARGVATGFGTQSNFGAYTSADGASYEAIGLAASAEGGTYYSSGIQASAEKEDTGEAYGIRASAHGEIGSESIYGGFFSADGHHVGPSYGIEASAHGFGPSANNFGGKFYVYGDGENATNYGIQASANGGDGTAAENFGGDFDAYGAGTTNYGIRASAGGATTNWAGFFDGDVKITDNLDLDGTLDIGGDLDVSGEVTASNLPSINSMLGETETDVGTSWENIVSVSITTQSPGNVLVTFTGFLQTDTAGGYLKAGIGENSTSNENWVQARSTDLNDYHPFTVQYVYANDSSGTFTYFGNAISSHVGGDVYRPYITAMFVQ
jgi:hypothetical protein